MSTQANDKDVETIFITFSDPIVVEKPKVPSPEPRHGPDQSEINHTDSAPNSMKTTTNDTNTNGGAMTSFSSMNERQTSTQTTIDLQKFLPPKGTTNNPPPKKPRERQQTQPKHPMADYYDSKQHQKEMAALQRRQLKERRERMEKEIEDAINAKLNEMGFDDTTPKEVVRQFKHAIRKEVGPQITTKYMKENNQKIQTDIQVTQQRYKDFKTECKEYDPKRVFMSLPGYEEKKKRCITHTDIQQMLSPPCSVGVSEGSSSSDGDDEQDAAIPEAPCKTGEATKPPENTAVPPAEQLIGPKIETMHDMIQQAQNDPNSKGERWTNVYPFKPKEVDFIGHQDDVYITKFVKIMGNTRITKEIKVYVHYIDIMGTEHDELVTTFNTCDEFIIPYRAVFSKSSNATFRVEFDWAKKYKDKVEEEKEKDKEEYYKDKRGVEVYGIFYPSRRTVSEGPARRQKVSARPEQPKGKKVNLELVPIPSKDVPTVKQNEQVVEELKEKGITLPPTAEDEYKQRRANMEREVNHTLQEKVKEFELDLMSDDEKTFFLSQFTKEIYLDVISKHFPTMTEELQAEIKEVQEEAGMYHQYAEERLKQWVAERNREKKEQWELKQTLALPEGNPLGPRQPNNNPVIVEDDVFVRCCSTNGMYWNDWKQYRCTITKVEPKFSMAVSPTIAYVTYVDPNDGVKKIVILGKFSLKENEPWTCSFTCDVEDKPIIGTQGDCHMNFHCKFYEKEEKQPAVEQSEEQQAPPSPESPQGPPSPPSSPPASPPSPPSQDEPSSDATSSDEPDSQGTLRFTVEGGTDVFVPFERYEDCLFVISSIDVLNKEPTVKTTIFINYLNEANVETADVLIEFEPNDNSDYKIVPHSCKIEEQPSIYVHGDCDIEVKGHYFRRLDGLPTCRYNLVALNAPNDANCTYPQPDYIYDISDRATHPQRIAKKTLADHVARHHFERHKVPVAFYRIRKREPVRIFPIDHFKFDDPPQVDLAIERKCAMIWSWIEWKSTLSSEQQAQLVKMNSKVGTRLMNVEVNIKQTFIEVFKDINKNIKWECSKSEYARMFQAMFDRLNTICSGFRGITHVWTYMNNLIPGEANDSNCPEELRLAAYRVGLERIKAIIEPKFFEKMFENANVLKKKFIEVAPPVVQGLILELTSTPITGSAQRVKHNIPDTIDWNKEEPWYKLDADPEQTKEEQSKSKSNSKSNKKH